MKKKINLVLMIGWMAFIFIMSSFNSIDSGNQSGFIVNIICEIFNFRDLDLLSLIVRKFAHFSEYLIFGILVSNFIKSCNKKNCYALIICILYAISDEIHQCFVPGRSCQLIDIAIDSSGALFGILLVNMFKNRRL